MLHHRPVAVFLAIAVTLANAPAVACTGLSASFCCSRRILANVFCEVRVEARRISKRRSRESISCGVESPIVEWRRGRTRRSYRNDPASRMSLSRFHAHVPDGSDMRNCPPGNCRVAVFTRV